MKRFLRILGILIVLIAAFFVVKTQTTWLDSVKIQATSLITPASLYCKEKGGTLQIVPQVANDTAGQISACIFDNGKRCEEGAFFKGECTKETGHIGFD